jgi:DNA-binding CsgD family transcriptional regulator
MERVGVDHGDLRLMRAVTRGYADDGGPVVPWELLHDLKALVPCDVVEASWQDTPSWTTRDQDLPELTEHTFLDVSAQQELYREHYWSSPCSYPDRTGDLGSVLRLSDLDSRSALRRSPIYCELFVPFDLVHEVMVVLDGGAAQRTVRLLFNRGPGRNFSERDVTVLTLLHPHLQAAYDSAEGRRRPPNPLTGRQRQVLALVAVGQTNRQIGRHLGMAEGTVRRHLEDAYARLGVNSRTEAVAAVDRYRPTS